MEHIKIDDPVLLDTFATDAKGRINLGERFADKTVKICVINVTDE